MSLPTEHTPALLKGGKRELEKALLKQTRQSGVMPYYFITGLVQPHL